LERKVAQGGVERIGARGDCFQLMEVAIEGTHESPGVVKSFAGIEERTTPSGVGHEGCGTAKRERKGQFPGQKTKLSFLSGGSD